MRGTRAKALRRAAYGPRSEWTKEGYFPLHPAVRSYTILKTYEKIVPRMIRADSDPGSAKEQAASIKLPGPGGVIYHYRYMPWAYNGEHRTDTERRKYQWAKRWWKRLGIVRLTRGW